MIIMTTGITVMMIMGTDTGIGTDMGMGMGMGMGIIITAMHRPPPKASTRRS